MNPELFIRVGIKPAEGVLLYGPPRNGKILLVRAIAKNIDANFLKLMSDGEILHAAPYHQLLVSSCEFQDLVNAHKETAGTERPSEVSSSLKRQISINEIVRTHSEKEPEPTGVDQLIKQEEIEVGSIGWKPYMQYLGQNKGYFYFFLSNGCHLIFVTCQILQNSWLASSVDNPDVSTLGMIVVYLGIGFSSMLFLFGRSLTAVALGMNSSESLFSQLLNSLFRAPMSFYDSTLLGRILSRVSTDLSIVDLDLPISLVLSTGTALNAYSNLAVLAFVTWPVLFVSITMVYFAIRLQNFQNGAWCSVGKPQVPPLSVNAEGRKKTTLMPRLASSTSVPLWSDNQARSGRNNHSNVGQGNENVTQGYGEGTSNTTPRCLSLTPVPVPSAPDSSNFRANDQKTTVFGIKLVLVASHLQVPEKHNSYLHRYATVLVVPVCYTHLAAAQMGQFIKFEEFAETSFGDRSHTSLGNVAVPELPRLHSKVAGSMFFC